MAVVTKLRPGEGLIVNGATIVVVAVKQFKVEIRTTGCGDIQFLGRVSIAEGGRESTECEKG